MKRRIMVDLPDPEERREDPYVLITPETGEIRECNEIRPLLSAACQDVSEGRLVLLGTISSHQQWTKDFPRKTGENENG